MAAFRRRILAWYEKNQRKLPWRETADPYRILLSEVMLQQTQVERVVPKYREFLRAFPTVQALAAADKLQLLRLWSGLGYNRRALLLQKAAQQIAERHQGKVPEDAASLMQLPGIGPYIAHAVLIFAYNQDVATIDTNIRRILIHEGLATEQSSQDELFAVARKLVPKGKSRLWHNALMDYGAIILTARKTRIRPLTTQSRFAGSGRYYRGQIIRLLTAQKSASIAALAGRFGKERGFVEKIADSLVKDGLVVREKGKVRIR
ncbi:MAG TPA: Fe-S cluster assembly protein HesB [Candidatus Nanoarchaeia archaeon]|nr:Fe-S cluster assembly protein HesB [Candidatus Nanoarchaeia archaeon]